MNDRSGVKVDGKKLCTAAVWHMMAMEKRLIKLVLVHFFRSYIFSDD